MGPLPRAKRRFATAGAVLLAAYLATPAAAANWPQWRGPDGDGASPETGLPLTWDAETNIAWKLPLPARSGATPIVWGDHVFLNVSEDPEVSDRLSLWAVDRASGEVRWKRPLGGGNELMRKHHMSSPSPVTDGELVWVMTGTGLLKAFTFDGEEVWSRDLQADYGPFGLKWGYASSPLLHAGSLIVQVLHGWYTDAPSYVLRLDAASGKTLWRVERPTQATQESPDAYTTPAVVRHGDGEEIVVSGGDVVTGHDPATGKELWRAGGLNPGASTSQRLVASPLVAGDLVLAFGKRGPVLALRPGGRGDVSESHLVWSMDKGTDVPTPVTDGRRVFIVNDRGVAWNLDARNGKVIWGPERMPAGGNFSASPVLADGRVYATDESGVTTVLKAADTFEVLAVNELEGFTLSSPAVSDGQIFLRTADHLWAIGGEDVAPPAPAAEGAKESQGEAAGEGDQMGKKTGTNSASSTNNKTVSGVPTFR